MTLGFEKLDTYSKQYLPKEQAKMLTLCVGFVHLDLVSIGSPANPQNPNQKRKKAPRYFYVPFWDSDDPSSANNGADGVYRKAVK